MADNPITGQLLDAVTLRDNERKLQAQYVTAERQKWRDRIRELTIQTVKISSHRILFFNDIRRLCVIRTELKVRLNLYDDSQIITRITNIINRWSPFSYSSRMKHIEDFENEISWLLKEDWERVKYETRPLWLWFYPKRKTKDGKRNGKYQEMFFGLNIWVGLLPIWEIISFFATVTILAASLAGITYAVSLVL